MEHSGTRPTIILVHGFWLGAWAWRDVIPPLVDAGYEVVAMTLPGLENETADRRDLTLADHIAAVVAEIDKASSGVVLVAHSAGSAPVHAAVDQRPDRVERAIYIDTRPLPDGEPLNATLAGASFEVPLRRWEEFSPGQLDGLDEYLLAHFVAHAVSHPARAARDRQILSDPRRFDVPVTIIPTTTTEAEMRAGASRGEPLLAELPRLKDLEFIEVPTGHYPMLSEPQALATSILRAVNRAN